MGASPMLLPVTSTARTSSVSSSILMCIFRQIRRLEPQCLRAFHSPSPSALMPVLSMSRFNGTLESQYGKHTFSVRRPPSANCFAIACRSTDGIRC